MPYSLDTSNFERAAWGQAALNALQQGMDADRILLTYCWAKTGARDLYEEPQLVANDAANDSLHALILRQQPDALHQRVVQPDSLDLTEFNALIATFAPNADEQEKMRQGSFGCCLEEQDEALSTDE